MTRCACAAMSASCVTRMIVLPPSCSRSNTIMISSPVFESRFPVGSSASRIDGLFTSARAIATRWRCPPESSFGRCDARSVSSTLSSAALARSDPILRRHAGVDQRQLDVVERGRARQQVEGLEDEPDLLVPDAGQVVVVHRRDFLAVEQVAALRRRVEAADQVHQRGLARPRRPHDRDVLAPLDVDREAAQRVDLLVAHHVGLPEIVRRNHSHKEHLYGRGAERFQSVGHQSLTSTGEPGPGGPWLRRTRSRPPSAHADSDPRHGSRRINARSSMPTTMRRPITSPTPTTHRRRWSRTGDRWRPGSR